MPPRLPILAALVAVVATLAACTSTPSPRESGAPPASAVSEQDYVSVGDSYAAGYQPAKDGGRGRGTLDGFAYQLVDKARSKGYALNVVNFGCSGATTASALTTPGCAERNLGPGATPYSKPQVAAAADYLRAHRGRIALVTVVLGGNDIAGCVQSASTSAATNCVTAALSRITTNLTTIATQLRAAAGPSVRIVGLTYPDVFLGEALSDDPQRRQLADLSTVAFSSVINPQLRAAYAKAKATFADVTTATGAYTPTQRTTTLAPYGTIPVAVADICRLTFYCAQHDIHPRRAGYTAIADLVVKQLPRR